MITNFIANLIGFSTFTINNRLLERYVLRKAISIFFDSCIDIINRKYFVLLRLKDSASGQIVTLHKGIVLSNRQQDIYYKYRLDILSIKSNDYTDKIFDQIIFI